MEKYIFGNDSEAQYRGSSLPIAVGHQVEERATSGCIYRPPVRECLITLKKLFEQAARGLAMRNELVVCCFMFLLVSVSSAQVPTADLLKPLADARHLIIESTGGKHGDSWSWITADGTRMGRESMNLRGQIWEVDYSGKPGANGMPAAMTIRGVTPQGDAGETFSIEGGTARWRSPLDSGSATYTGHAFYSSVGGPMDTNA